MQAQAAGLSKLVASSERASVDGIIGCVAFDDANAWIQKPNLALVCVGPNKAVLEQLFRLKKKQRGTNICMPVFNKVEALHCVESTLPIDGPPLAAGMPVHPEPRLRSALVVAPAQVLPQSNTSTIRSCFNQWTVTSPGGPGKKVDPDGRIMEAFNNSLWKTAIYVHDNLGVNHCLMALEMQPLQ